MADGGNRRTSSHSINNSALNVTSAREPVGSGADLKVHPSWLSLQFKDPNVEAAFHNVDEAFSPLSLLGGPLVTICAAPVWRLQPWGPFTWGGAGVVALFGVVLAGATCLGSAVRATWLRRTLALLMIFSLMVFLLLDMVQTCTRLSNQYLLLRQLRPLVGFRSFCCFLFIFICLSICFLRFADLFKIYLLTGI